VTQAARHLTPGDFASSGSFGSRGVFTVIVAVGRAKQLHTSFVRLEAVAPGAANIVAEQV
jgi:hypothetical protein